MKHIACNSGLNWTQATKRQLFQITTDSDCSLDLSYAACRELQRRAKRAAKHEVSQIWRSMRSSILLDFDNLRHKILQLRDEMTACGVSESTARDFLDNRLSSLNRKIQNTSKGVARKHVKRS